MLTTLERILKFISASGIANEHNQVDRVEVHVVELDFNRLVAAGKNITLLLTHFPLAVDSEDTLISAVTLKNKPDYRIPV